MRSPDGADLQGFCAAQNLERRVEWRVVRRLRVTVHQYEGEDQTGPEQPEPENGDLVRLKPHGFMTKRGATFFLQELVALKRRKRRLRPPPPFAGLARRRCAAATHALRPSHTVVRRAASASP